MKVPEIRRCKINSQPVVRTGKYVLYWMTAQRRTHSNFALQLAVQYAEELRKPLLVFEALRSGYHWASDRLHRFVIEGMNDNAAACAESGVTYFPYLEPEPGAGAGLLSFLAQQSAVVVTDEFPCFFLPHMVQVAGQQLEVLLETVDSNGLVPLRAPQKDCSRAFDFRRWLQKYLVHSLGEFPLEHPLETYTQGAASVPRGVASKWPSLQPQAVLAKPEKLQSFPIDHTVSGSAVSGGSQAAQKQLQWFLKNALTRYHDDRSHPDTDASSGLSPYLHFGHISTHQIFTAAMATEHWQPKQISGKITGSNEGWWGTSPALESFLDELITWRELSYVYAFRQPDYHTYRSLPAWALATLEKHARDRREFTYTLEEFAASQTHDRIWNAAQTQLREEGRLHNYLRMLWGKKILEWTNHPRKALQIMLELNNRYALDGRDPNSYSGIFWVLGRFDRAWGPERNIFGVVRYMSSESTIKKLRMKQYLAKYAPAGA